MIVAGLVAGGAVFGFGPLPTFSGTTLSTAEALTRVVGSGAYILLAASGVTAVGLWISTLTDSGPGAIVATVIVAIASQVIDQIPSLHVMHPVRADARVARASRACSGSRSTGAACAPD